MGCTACTEPQCLYKGALYFFTLLCAGYPVSVSGMITVPVSASMYQTVVANLQQIHTQGDSTLQVRSGM